jgi:hypothetical protein
VHRALLDPAGPVAAEVLVGVLTRLWQQALANF